MKAYVALLRRRPDFRRLWAAELVSMVGDWFSIVAVSIVSLASPGGGVLSLATALAAHLLPQAFAAPFGGWLADRLDKRSVLIGSSLLEGGLTVGMAIAAARGEVFVMQVLLCARSMASSAREPATGSALPRLVERGELAAANGLSAFTWSVAFAVGMSLGGLATALGAEVALAIDALTFFVAVMILRHLPALPRVSWDLDGERVPRFAPLADILSAARAAWRPSLRRSIFAQAPIAFASGCAWLSLNLAGHVLPIAFGAATTVGLLQAVRGVGTGVGPLLVSSRFAGGRAADVAALAVVASSLLLSWAPSIALVTAAAFLWGAGSGALWVIVMTEIQERAPEESRGRMIALSGLTFTVTMSVGAIITALVLDGGASPFVASVPAAAVALLGWALVRQPAREAIALA